ncbi:hypothetical protein [Agrobacterium sp. CG674]
MAIIEDIRNELLRLDEKMGEPGYKGGLGFSISRDSGEHWRTIKLLQVASGKMEDVTHEGAFIRYPGFSLTNVFDRFVREKIESTKHVVLTQVARNSLEGFNHLSHTYAGKWDSNFDDDGWAEVDKMHREAAAAGDAETFSMEIFNVSRRNAHRTLTSLIFASFKPSANAKAIEMKLLLS